MTAFKYKQIETVKDLKQALRSTKIKYVYVGVAIHPDDVDYLKSSKSSLLSKISTWDNDLEITACIYSENPDCIYIN